LIPSPTSHQTHQRFGEQHGVDENQTTYGFITDGLTSNPVSIGKVLYEDGICEMYCCFEIRFEKGVVGFGGEMGFGDSRLQFYFLTFIIL
jgi:hypothetical protein